jgi:type I restriction enzyme S subunit
MKKYDQYKNSGVEWLGEIPEHWEVLSNKNIFKLNKNLVGKKSSEYDLLSLTLNGVIKRDMENPQGKFPAEFDTYQEVKKGDFIFCLFDVEETPRTVGLSDFDGMITGAYTVMQVNENYNKSFLYYFYLNLDAGKRMKPLYTGLRNTISKDNFFAFKTFLPPFQEQKTIALFLDDKTAKIDQAIAIKQKQIELIKERRQILIHKAVTRGLNENVKLKDSGVEWIGEIPEHWEVKKLGYLTCKIGDGLHGTPNYTDGTDFYFINGNNLSTGNIEITEQTKTVSEREYFLHKKELTDKTLLLSINGTIGNVAFYCGEKVMLGKSAAYLNFYKNINIVYVKCFLESTVFKNYYELQLSGSTINNFSLYSIGKTPITFPCDEEQNQIVEHIEKISTKIATAISLKEREIEKLKEYKMSLVDGVVTGKVRVI